MEQEKLVINHKIPSDFPYTPESFYQQITSQHIAAFNERIKEYLTENLKLIGICFNTDAEFLEFISTRLTRIKFEDNPNYYEFYLDFVNEENRGRLVGSYSDKTKIVHNGNTITATFG